MVPAIKIHGFELHENVLTVHGEPTFEEWEACGHVLQRIQASSQWWLGDWWLAGERRYGEAAAQGASLGVAAKTIQNAAWVCQCIEPSRRRESLSYTHHECVAALPASRQDEVLDRAEADGLSTRQVKELVQQANGHLTHYVLVSCESEDDAMACCDRLIADGRTAKVITKKA